MLSPIVDQWVGPCTSKQMVLGSDAGNRGCCCHDIEGDRAESGVCTLGLLETLKFGGFLRHYAIRQSLASGPFDKIYSTYTTTG